MPNTSLFENPVCPTPDPSGGTAEVRGGYDFPDGGRKETPNTVSGLPAQPTIIGVPDGPTRGTSLPPPDMSKDMYIGGTRG